MTCADAQYQAQKGSAMDGVQTGQPLPQDMQPGAPPPDYWVKSST